MNSAEFLVQCLRSEGVEVAFGVPGDGSVPLLDAMGRGGIRLVAAHTTAAAVWMAAGYGSLSRAPGVCFSGAGAGAVQMSTALAACTRDGFPVVAVVAGERLDTGTTVHPEHLDLSWALRPFCKQTASLAWGPSIRNEVREAFRQAYREKPGAVALALPADVATHPVDSGLAPVSAYRQGRAFPEPKAVEEAARHLDSAQRPVILAGHGVVRSGAHEELLAAAEKGNIPVVCTYMGKSAMPFDHPLLVAYGGGTTPDHAHRLLQAADVVLCCGYDRGEWCPSQWNPRFQASILHLGELPANVDVHYSPAVEAVGDLNAGLSRLAALLEPRDHRAWSGPEGTAVRLKRQLQAEMEQARHDGNFPLHPGHLVQALRQNMRSQDLLAVDVGAHQEWAGRLFQSYLPGTYYTSGAFKAVGFALPCAIGLAVALGRTENHRVVALCGDGGFLQQAAEMETAVRLGLPVVCVVACDRQYAENEQQSQQQVGRGWATGFGPVDVVQVARAMGAYALQVDAAEQAGVQLRGALEAGRPTVVAVPVSPGAQYRAQPVQAAAATT